MIEYNQARMNLDKTLQKILYFLVLFYIRRALFTYHEQINKCLLKPKGVTLVSFKMYLIQCEQDLLKLRPCIHANLHKKHKWVKKK